jgi:rRNA maturation RNase YbeY
MKPQINFYNLDKFDLNLGDEIKNWLSAVIMKNGFNYSEINYTFFTDEELLQINRDYLNHDFYTDIITFDNTIKETISSDIMISIDRVKENARDLNVDVETELLRVMAHGILHCMGYDDKTTETKALMRKKEDEVLNMFHVEQKIKENNV